MATIKFKYRTPTMSGKRNPDSATDSAANDPVPSEPPELQPVKVDRWWRESSFDLWHGLEVREDASDTIPAEWLDELDLP